MNKANIYPCLWFDQEGKSAAEFYTDIFPDSEILSSDALVTRYNLLGCPFMNLNGGPRYQKNPSVSFFVYGAAQIDDLYMKLKDGGKVFMPLGKYDWSEKYAWVEDKFGVSWQLDADEINSDQKIVPCLLMTMEQMQMVKKAAEYYCSILTPSQILMSYPPESKTEEVVFSQIRIRGMLMNIMSGRPENQFGFTPGISMVVECENQDEIDNYWELLGKNGRYDVCGWLSDAYGFSWQIVPEILGTLMNGPNRQQVIDAFLKMQKFDIEALKQAANSRAI